MTKELTTPEVFWAKLNKNGPICIHPTLGNIGECWQWTGCRKDGKYGVTSVNYRQTTTHRLAYEFGVGEIPHGLCVLHKCDNMICCRPSHLFVGTRRRNSDDKVEKNRQSKGESHSKATEKNRVKGEKHFRARFTAESVREIRDMFDNRGMSIPEIAKALGDRKSAIYKIAHRKRWKHIP